LELKIWTKATGGISAELSDAKNPQTFKAIRSALPIKASVATWGDEIYFPAKIKGKKEDQQPFVEKGDIAYWPPGDSLCIFFGPTPVSMGSEIRPASPVNVVGKVLGNSEAFRKVKDGDEIVIDKAE